MEIGLGIFNGISYEKQVECFKKLGVKRTFIGSYIPEFERIIKLFRDNGIICETLHAPFDGINNMWLDDESGDVMLERLKDCIDKCSAYEIPVAIVHASSGRPMPEISEYGLKRYDELFDYARKKGVKIALENLRYAENVMYLVKRYPDAGSCWDIGHENCFSDGEKFLELFGDRLIALHIQDNRCIKDYDDHLIPFDGNIDFEDAMRHLAKCGYNGTMMLEIGRDTVIDGKKVYADLTDEEYIIRAVDAAKKLASMVESYNKGE